MASYVLELMMYFFTKILVTSSAHKLKVILLLQLIATLNNYAYSLPPLANVN